MGAVDAEFGLEIGAAGMEIPALIGAVVDVALDVLAAGVAAAGVLLAAAVAAPGGRLEVETEAATREEVVGNGGLLDFALFVELVVAVVAPVSGS